MSACSTVPNTKDLMFGMDLLPANATTDAATKTAVLKAQDDPVCELFYENVVEAAVTAQKNRSMNAQLVSMGFTLATAFIGVPQVGGLADAAGFVAYGDNVFESLKTGFNPEKKFDRKVITTALEIGCPLTILEPVEEDKAPDTKGDPADQADEAVKVAEKEIAESTEQPADGP